MRREIVLVGSLSLVSMAAAEPSKAEQLKAKLEASDLQPEHVTLSDTSDGCGDKFEAIIVSEKFGGMPLLQRQQAVNGVLADEMPSIHAFSMKTWTPGQYKEKMGGGGGG